MKKLIALLIALVCIVITISACTPDGGETETTGKTQTTTAPEEITTEEVTEPATHEDEEGKGYSEIHPAA